MKSNLVCLALLCATGAYGQAMIEHAAAAAGAAVGVGGGKLLSNALDQVLGQAVKAAGNEAAPKPVVKPAAQAARASLAGDRGPVSAAGSQPRNRRARPASEGWDKPVFAASADRFAPVRVAPPLPPPPSPADFAKLKEGDSRKDVLAALGIPSSHITIPDEGHLIEIMTYQDRSRRIGSVRVDNGQVVSIQTSER